MIYIGQSKLKKTIVFGLLPVLVAFSACGIVVNVGCYRGDCRCRKFWKHWIVLSGPLYHASNSSGDSPEGSDCSLSLGSVSPRGGH